MAETVITDARIYVGDKNLSGSHNQVSLNFNAELKDKTVFGSSARKRAVGLLDIEMNAQGFTNFADNQSDEIYKNVVGSSAVVTVAPSAGAVRTPAYSFQAIGESYKPYSGGAIGDVLQFEIGLKGLEGRPLVPGKILLNGNKSANFTSTAVNIGTAGSTQKLFGILHIISVSSSGKKPAIRARIQSAASSGFSSPTTRIAFTSSTGVKAQFATPVAGPITHPWVRVNATVTSSSATYGLVVSAGVR